MKSKIILRFLGVGILLLLSSLSNAQDIISISELTKNGYQYDVSIHIEWLNKNQISKNDSILNKIRNRLDSVAKSLNLGLDDKVIVYIDVAEITKNNLKGLYKLNGDVIFEPKFVHLSNIYPSKLWSIRINGKYGLLNPTSKDIFLFRPIYDDLTLSYLDSSDVNYLNRYEVRLNNMYGIIDSVGTEILPLEYSELDVRNKQLYLAKKGGKYGFIKPSGAIVIPFMYDACYHFWDNRLAPVKLGKKWGLINRENVLVVDIIYDDMFFFQEGILRVELNNKTGFLNKQGKIFVDLKYDAADAKYNNEVLRVKLGGKFAIINKKGKELCDFIYDSIGKFRYPCTQVMINGKFGVLNNKGKEILPVKYDKIDIENNLIIVWDGANKTYYDFGGKN